jgi:hypothetical protein
MTKHYSFSTDPKDVWGFDQARADLFTAAAKEAQEGMGQCSFWKGNARCLQPTTRVLNGRPMCQKHYDHVERWKDAGRK